MVFPSFRALRVFLVPLVLSAVPALVFSQPGGPSRPNIILVYVDDLAYGDLGAFGAPDIPTPHIDSFAEEGIRLTNFWTAAAACSPSRVALMTGLYPQRFGKYSMNRGQEIPRERPTLAASLRRAGYATGGVIMEKWDIGDREQGPLDVGFEKVALYPPPGTHEVEMATGGGEKYIGVDGSYLTEVQGDAVVEFIDRHADGKEPFFLYFTPLAVHSPLVEVPEKYLERVPDDVLKRGGRKDGKPTDVNYRRYLVATIIALDDQIGRMTERLRRHGIERETFVVLTSDNGGNLFDGARPDPYRGGKFGPNTQWAGYLRMPAILSWPGALPEGAVFDGLASTLDLYPTLCAAAKAVPPEPLDGVDLLPVLTGQTKPDPARALVWELRLGGLTLGPRNNVLRSVVRGDWRLVKFNESGWRLYDLDEDPAERKNLASRHPALVRQLRQVFADWRSAMADPLRLEWRPGGPVPYGFDGWMTVGEWQEVKDEPRLWKEDPVRWRYLNEHKERN